LAACPRLRAVVESKLELRWSPQQISGWLVGEFPNDPEMRVSHETIYLSLFVQARGALRKELTRFLRSKHTTRRPRGHSVMNGQGQLRATLNIRERPPEANDRVRAENSSVPVTWALLERVGAGNAFGCAMSARGVHCGACGGGVGALKLAGSQLGGPFVGVGQAALRYSLMSAPHVGCRRIGWPDRYSTTPALSGARWPSDRWGRCVL
jgi:hypothetical protein